MKSLFSLASLSLLFVACGSQYKKAEDSKNTTTQTVNPTTYAETITEAELKDMLYTYASDEFAGRETGTEGETKAINYLKAHYMSNNVAAAKGNNDYFQNVPLEELASPNVTLTANGKALKNLEDIVSITPMPTSKFSASQVIDLGYGIESETYSNYKNVDIKDKVVLIRSGEPKNEDGTYLITGTEEASKWSNFRQEFATKRDLAKDKGAKAVLYYNPNVFAMAAMRYGSSSGRMVLSGNDNKMYYILLNDNAANAILNSNTTIDNTFTNKTINATIDIDYTNNSKPLKANNVVAVIEGSEKPEEYIVISAHLDHIGIHDGEINNGADDDGSGTVAVLEIAEAFAKAKKDGHGPKRSIVFLNVTGEEKGLLGSSYYADQDPIFPLSQTVANLNIDMIGRTDPKREGDRNYVYLIGSDKLSTDLHNISEEVNTKYSNIELDYTYNDENDPNRFYFRSDHYNFAKNNIPVIFYFNGTHDDYHRPSDTPDKIEYDLLQNRARLVFYTAWELANREQRIIVDKAE